MVVPYDKPKMLASRYGLLSPQLDQATEKNVGSHDNGQKYATFMRTLANENLRKDLSTREENPTPKGKRKVNGLVDTKTTPADKEVLPTKSMSAPPLNVHTLTQIKQKNEEVHEKKMKAVEGVMWQHRQQERELKRIERDLINREKQLQNTMTSYEKEIDKAKNLQEHNLVKADQEVEKVRQKHATEIDRTANTRADRNIEMQQKLAEKSSKAVNMVNSMQFRYEEVAEAIRLKRVEVERMAKEFQTKMLAKEEEEYRLKKEFANLAVELNATAQKHRVNVETANKAKDETTRKDINDDIKRSENLENNVKVGQKMGVQAEQAKRKYSIEHHGRLADLQVKGREDARRLMDSKARLAINAANQKRAKLLAEQTDLENKGAQSEEKVTMVNMRRAAIQDMIVKQRRSRNDQSMDEWKQRHFQAHHDSKIKSLEDTVGHFSKMVNRNEELDQNLFNKVRTTEADRKQSEQSVTKTRTELLETRRKNKEHLKQLAIKCANEEKALECKLIRDEAVLAKSLANREETIQLLCRHRDLSKEDKHMLLEEQKNQQRLLRIEQRTNLVQQQQMMQETY